MNDEIEMIDDESFKPSLIAGVMHVGVLVVALVAVIFSIFDKETVSTH